MGAFSTIAATVTALSARPHSGVLIEAVAEDISPYTQSNTPLYIRADAQCSVAIGDTISVSATDSETLSDGTVVIHGSVKRISTEIESGSVSRGKCAVQTVNYRGVIVDCYDASFGIYNLDNEHVLIGSLSLPPLTTGATVLFYNLHAVPVQDAAWLTRVIGPLPRHLRILLVFCPAFSTCEGVERLSVHEPISDLCALLHAYVTVRKWGVGPVSLELVDAFASCMQNREGGARFLGHAHNCRFTARVDEPVADKELVSVSGLKKLSSAMADELRVLRPHSSVVRSMLKFLPHVVIRGKLIRKTARLFELVSDGERMLVYCADETTLFGYANDALIFNAHLTMELVPQLRYANAWSKDSCLWLSPWARVWCCDRLLHIRQLATPPSWIECVVKRKYVCAKTVNDVDREVTVIEVESVRGAHKLTLSPADPFHMIFADCPQRQLFAPRLLLHPSVLDNPQQSVSSWQVEPVLRVRLDHSHSDANVIRVHISDLPHMTGWQSIGQFCILARITALISIVVQLTCRRCESAVQSGRCLQHQEQFEPKLLAKAAFQISDSEGSSAVIYIDRYSLLEQIMAWSTAFRQELVLLLTRSGQIQLNHEDVSPSSLSPPSLLVSAVRASSFRAGMWLMTFPGHVASSILRPTKMRPCDMQAELLTLVHIFESNMQVGK